MLISIEFVKKLDFYKLNDKYIVTAKMIYGHASLKKIFKMYG